MFRVWWLLLLPVVCAEIDAFAYSGSAPWSVLILLSNGSDAALCSGTAVGSFSILTAAHCLTGYNHAIVYSSPSAGGVNATCLQSVTRWALACFFKARGAWVEALSPSASPSTGSSR